MKIVTLAIFFTNFLSIGQNEISGYYLESRKRADLVINKLLEKNYFDISPYALLSSNNSSYLIILDRNTHFSMAWVELKHFGKIELISVRNEPKSNKELEFIFDFKDYHEEFISWDSDFYKDGYDLAKGASTYFVVRKADGKRYGESVLSMLVSPNPIDTRIYGLMVSELIGQNK